MLNDRETRLVQAHVARPHFVCGLEEPVGAATRFPGIVA